MSELLEQESAVPSVIDDVNDCVESEWPFSVDAKASAPEVYSDSVLWSIANPCYEEEVPYQSSLTKSEVSATDSSRATVDLSLSCNDTAHQPSKMRRIDISAKSDKVATAVQSRCQSRHESKPTSLLPVSAASDYDVHQLIGSGGEGTVYSGTRLCDGLKVALKDLPRKKIKRFGFVNGCKVPIEFDLLHKASGHPGIINMVGWFEDSDSYVLVMERQLGMVDLFQLSCDHKRFPEELTRCIFTQLAKAVMHCHNNGVIHRDIKPENILVNPTTFEIKLIDFGCATTLQDSALTRFAGTRLFYPPEWYMERRYYGKRLDVWCLGLVLYEMVEGRPPFTKPDDIVQRKAPVRYGNDMSKGYRHLISWMLRKDQSMRPTLKAVLAHPWMQGE